MKVVLLAAGQSKRFKPIQDKNFLSFLGKPLIQHQIEQLLEMDLKDIILIGGAHNIAGYRSLMKTLSPSIQLREQKKLHEGMAGALLSIEKEIRNEPILILSANDVMTKSAYKSIINAQKTQKADIFLLAKKVESYFPGGYLKMNKTGKIQGLIEKPGAGNEPSNLVNLVLHFHRDTKKLFQTLKSVATSKDDHYETALDKLIHSGVRTQAVQYKDFWQALKYPWHVLRLMDHFLQNIAPFSKKFFKEKKIEIAPSAILRGNIYLEEGVRILDQAIVQGPAYIGKNTIIATNAMVRQSHLGEDCVIGFGSEIARSFLGNQVWTHTNYIGDSVIGNNCSFGSGTVTGNLRLDENTIAVNIQDEKIDSGLSKFGIITGNNIRCGINSSFMPGVKIGNDVFIGAGIVISGDIPDNHFVYHRPQLEMRVNKAKLNIEHREKLKNKI